MNKNRDFKDTPPLQPNEEEDKIVGAIFESAGMSPALRLHTINLGKIVTPQPYSVFTLCILYENSQRN